MITEIKLSNFKAFGEGQNEELRTATLSKITLIYGPNSAGKSSLVQSLLLLKQSDENRHEPACLNSTGQYCDLGSFNALVHQHDIEREVQIGVRFSPEDTAYNYATQFYLRGKGRNAVHLNRFKYERVGSRNRALVDMTSRDAGENRFKIGEDTNIPLGLGDRRSDSPVDWEGIDIEASPRDLIPSFPNVLPGYRAALYQPLDEKIDALSREIAEISIRTPRRRTLEAQRLSLEREKERINLQLRQTRSVLTFLRRELRDISWDLRTRLLANMSYLGPTRIAPQRIYRDLGAHSGVGISGEHLFGTIASDSDSIDKINGYFQEFEIPYVVNTVDIAADDNLGVNAGVISLRSTRTRSVHTLVDVGFGISQILPTIVEGVAGSATTICVDEPEIHIHPRLQAKVADLLVETCNEKQWIIETHSELLARRIQTHIYQGRISPEDVSILYVDPPREGRDTKDGIDATSSYISRLQLDDEGDWIDPWPQEFFADSHNELVRRL